MSEKNIHENHRNRLKERFLREGLDNFNHHNVIELLLFYSIPRRDTNEIAHELMRKFGSISKLLDADYTELLEVKGISDHTATLIKILPELFRLYSIDKISAGITINTIERITEFLTSYYLGITKETVVMVSLNNRNEMISCDKLHEGSVNMTIISPRLIMETGIRNRASSFILAHNHPDGDVIPSDEDLSATIMLKKLFTELEMPMLEHFIISGTKNKALVHEITVNRSNVR